MIGGIEGNIKPSINLLTWGNVIINVVISVHLLYLDYTCIVNIKKTAVDRACVIAVLIMNNPTYKTILRR